MPQPVNVLFVCMGNICRSPTAEAMFRHIIHNQGLSSLIHTDSCGTHAYHIGEQPDSRSQAHAKKRGIAMGDLRARQFASSDWEEFDYILAMDRQNYQILQQSHPGGNPRGQLSMMLDHGNAFDERDVPDPYYGGDLGFELVLDMLEDSCKGLLDHIRAKQQ